ncbi:hypothetical protein POM88_035690 [Heracleum sosnowskyi]|uniref:Uncharacterized protein n=1 Tax=Heracleum sosnowskyi TaxID=360622 RepID=A0AAD8HNQ6_9APIA|nr:hypothetical protein POM88_035690 [Heracleum sosnowskyi]
MPTGLGARPAAPASTGDKKRLASSAFIEIHLLQETDDFISLTKLLKKYINSKINMYRAKDFSVRITNGTLLTQIKRYLKQAIVDKDPAIASVAYQLIYLLLLPTNLETVKKLSNEAVEARAAFVQFHALALHNVETFQMLKEVGCFAFLNLSRIENSHIFLLRFYTSLETLAPANT